MKRCARACLGKQVPLRELAESMGRGALRDRRALLPRNATARQQVGQVLGHNYLLDNKLLLLRRNSVPQTFLAGSTANTALGGDRLDLHNVPKFSEAFNQALFLLVG